MSTAWNAAGNGTVKLVMVLVRNDMLELAQRSHLIRAVILFPLEEWAPWPASSGGPLNSSGHGWHLNGPGPYFSFVLKQHCWAFASRLLTLCWPAILSTYLLSLTQPPNSQGYLSNHARSSLTCSLKVWDSDPRIGSRMLRRDDIRGWKRGHGLNRKRCVG